MEGTLLLGQRREWFVAQGDCESCFRWKPLRTTGEESIKKDELILIDAYHDAAYYVIFILMANLTLYQMHLKKYVACNKWGINYIDFKWLNQLYITIGHTASILRSI